MIAIQMITHVRKCAGVIHTRWSHRSRLQKRVRFTYLHTMKDSSPLEVLNDLLDPLSRCLDAESARRVAEFRIAPEVEEKILGLAEKANEGVLNEDERADYEAIINTADIISILKLKAERHLKSNGS